jgi:hypothetical protein
MSKDNLRKNLLKSTTSSAERVAATTEAAKEVVAMETSRQQLAGDEQQQREQLIGKAHEMAGQIRAVGMVSKFLTVSSLVWLRQSKQAKIYKDMPGIGTWKKYCDYIGLSQQTVDENLRNLAAFGEDFLLTVNNLSVGYRELRKLRGAAKEGQLLIDDEVIEINGSRIPLDPDHGEDIQAEIDVLIDAKDRVLKEKEATIKAKERVLEEKEKVIQRQEEVIGKHEQTLKQRGFAAGEEEFLKGVENFSTTVHGLCMMVDPDNLPPKPTPVMTSTYIEAMGKAWRTIKGYYDNACERFGDPLDDDWLPPNLRGDVDQGVEAPEEHPCVGCGHRKARANSRKGILIDGYHGKCTNDAGHCEEYIQHISAN